MASVTKTNLIRGVKASGMSTAEQKALINIIDSAPASMWGAAQAAAPTAADGGTVDATWGAAEAAVVNNNVTRIAEVIAALQTAGIMAS